MCINGCFIFYFALVFDTLFMKKIILTFFFVIGLTIVSCIRERCPPIPSHFKITGLTTWSLKYADDGSEWVNIMEGDTVKWDFYINRIGFEAEYFASVLTKSYSPFGNSLYALSCSEHGYKGSKVGVKNIHVITLNNYDSVYTKNDTINDIIRLNYWSNNITDTANSFSIADYVLQNDSSVRKKYFEMMVQTPPVDSLQETKFKIVYELNNGERFEAVTESVVLQK